MKARYMHGYDHHYLHKMLMPCTSRCLLKFSTAIGKSIWITSIKFLVDKRFVYAVSICRKSCGYCHCHFVHYRQIADCIGVNNNMSLAQAPNLLTDKLMLLTSLM